MTATQLASMRDTEVSTSAPNLNEFNKPAPDVEVEVLKQFSYLMDNSELDSGSVRCGSKLHSITSDEGFLELERRKAAHGS
jgi:hypothetical protein